MQDHFPAERAAQTVHHLAGEIGRRIPGQPGFERALTWLRAQLESLEGWEVQVQEATAGRIWGKAFTCSCHVNLVARFRGAEPGAILVNAHLDSPPSSVGAADDGAAVAVMLEAARLISAGPQPRRSLIFLFNGSEEYGMQGALSFVEQHPWAKDVLAFINLEAAGCAGPFTLFQSSDRLPALLKAYRSVPRPASAVVAQDLWDSRIFKYETDYRVLANHGLHGVDMALTGDGYAYHTWRDQPDRIPLQALEEMGGVLMALLNRLDGERDLTPTAERTGMVYFPLLGRSLVTYPKRLAPWLLGLAAAVAGVAAWGLPWWSGLLRHLGAVLAALMLPMGAAWVMSKLTRFELWWFAHPAATGAAWVSLSLAAMAGVQALFPMTTPAAWAGVLAFWLLLAGLAVWRRLGSAYMPTAWLLAGALGLLLWPWSPLAAILLATGIGAAVSASAVADLMRFLPAHLGRLAFPSHIAMAGVLGFFTLGGASFLPLPPALLWLAAAAVVLLAVAAALPWVTHERSEQLSVIDLQHGDGAHRLLFPLYRQFSPAVRRQLGGVHAGTLAEPLWKRHLLAPKAAAALPLADATNLGAPPTLELLSDETGGEQRCVTVRCTSSGYAVVLSAAQNLLAMTVDAGDGRPRIHEKSHRVRFVNPPPEGIQVTFALPAGSPLHLTASSWYLSDEAPSFGPATSVVYQKAALVQISL